MLLPSSQVCSQRTLPGGGGGGVHIKVVTAKMGNTLLPRKIVFAGAAIIAAGTSVGCCVKGCCHITGG
jgi:hypothetical protein